MNTPDPPRVTWPMLITTFVVLALLAGLFAASTLRMSSHHGPLIKSVTNCRQIIIAVRLYAADEGGKFPDSSVPGAKDSNTVFRQLFVAGALEDEMIFRGGGSRFLPDREIGPPPDYARALEPGENHWAMTKGADDTCPGTLPLVFENPVRAAWPPAWNVDAAGQDVKGRAWEGGKIIIGTADTSVELMKLSSRRGTEVRLAPMKAAKENLFEMERKFPDGSIDGTRYEVLDVAVREER